MTAWLVYTRPDCSLCEAMLEDLAQVLGPEAAAAAQVLDITGDPDLERKYGHKVPALLADGEFLCCYRLDRERMQPYLAAP